MILADPELRANLVAKTIFVALTFALIAGWLTQTSPDTAQSAWLISGLVVGTLLACFQSNLRRQIGLSVMGSVLFALGALWLVATDLTAMNGFGGFVFGLGAGAFHVASTRAYLASLPRGARLSGVALRIVLIGLACGGMYYALTAAPHLFALPGSWALAGIAAATSLYLCVIWHREALEQIIEVLIWPMYNIRRRGVRETPVRGPLLVVANHAAWFDPLYLAKVLPRRLTPMMVSSFYDLPGLRWFMVHVFHAIRVQKAHYRREAPELQQAIDMLDRGGCVVIFPEGGMRRKLEAPLRRFGQGVWHILKARPNTPVVVCWIEGNWGSYCSYYNGLPTKNKRPDLRRTIDVAVGEVHTADPALLDDHVKTRRYLMEKCLQTRTLLGLPLFPMPEMPETEDEENDIDAA